MNEIRIANYMQMLNEITDQRPLAYENGEISWLMPNDAGGYGMAEYGPYLTNRVKAMLAGFESEAAWRHHNEIVWRNERGGKRGRAITPKGLARRSRR